jgi:uncharacterized protein (DUF1697 family)
MTLWAVLLRGVNVGGQGRLPKDGFRALLADLGLDRPETCIQSGNAVFGSALARAELERSIPEAVQACFGFRPDCVLRRDDEMIRAAAHPFPGADPRKVHAFFLRAPCAALDAAALAALAAPDERCVLAGDVCYLWAPAGIGRSALATAMHRVVPGIVTARNLRTVGAIAAMIEARKEATFP